MPENQEIKKAFLKRLTPLYIASFFQGFVLWYNIEKLFMHDIGFSDSAIGLMIAVYSFVMLAVNSPSGILADRWSRKGVLIIASISLMLSSVVGGLSHNVVDYLGCAVLWGIFYACNSGIYDSIIYDVITEAKAPSKIFEYLYGRWQVIDGVALMSAGLLGGLLASRVNLRATYFISAPLGFFSIWALLKFREPTLHKEHEPLTIKQQIKLSYQAILQNRALFPVISVLVLEAVLIFGMYEFAQLWLFALHLRTAYFGIANAVLLASLVLGGSSVDRLKMNRYVLTLCVLLLLITACVGLIVSRNIIVIVLFQLLYATCLINISVIFSRILHDGLSANIRAGASSSASTLGRLVLIPIALLFGYLSQKYSIYEAAYTLLALAILMAMFVVVVANRSNHKGLDPIT